MMVVINYYYLLGHVDLRERLLVQHRQLRLPGPDGSERVRGAHAAHRVIQLLIFLGLQLVEECHRAFRV